MREEEVERQQEWILGAPQVVRNRGSPVSKDLIVDSSGSVVHQPWPQFTLIAGQLKVDVTWSRDQVLVSA